jgi:osmotically-inducible protein OsmY
MMKNNPELQSGVIDTIKQKDIKNALSRSFINHYDINIKVSGTAATLSGKTISLYQKEEAERIVGKTPGIWHVNNKLELNF